MTRRRLGFVTALLLALAFLAGSASDGWAMTRRRLGLVAALLLALLLGLALLAGCASDESASGSREGGATLGADRSGYALTVTKLGIEQQPLASVGLNPDRTIQVPPVDHPEVAAVYSKGPQPGEVGPAVVLGHVNGGGRPGVFARLDELVEGDRITTTDPDGATSEFVVYRTITVRKAAFPTAEVYSDAPGPELRLITCGGDLDRSAHNYTGQVIVFARRG